MAEKKDASRRLLSNRRFLVSCVSNEFRSYRNVLNANLTQPGIELRRQEDFVNAGGTTIEKLNYYVRTCDAVIHLVGHATGAHPTAAEVEAFLSTAEDLPDKLRIGDLLESPGLSYTQWEAWLAIYHEKPLLLYRATDSAEREPGFVSDAEQRERQQRHWQQLERLGRDRKEFVSADDLSISVLRALPSLVPEFADHVEQGEFRDRNLLFAVLALQDEILTPSSFARVCTLWAADSSASIAIVMEQEGLLDERDRQLVEARLARKLKSNSGDVRKSLAACLDSGALGSLAQTLDPATLASLPDRAEVLTEMADEAGDWRYRLTRTHASGGLGIVSVAEDRLLQRDVALKQLRPERTLDPMAIERFLREARITGRLQHPNIVPVYELGVTPDDQVPFYAMRFVGHRTLQDAIAEYYAKKENAEDQTLRFRELLQSFVAVCNAVAYAHEKQVVHRDLKPANVMIGEFGEVILLDWGLAKYPGEDEVSADAESASRDAESEGGAHSTPDQTLAGTRLGSPAYMSPEQAAGHIHLHGARTDVYGLGVTLYELLTGDVPFTGATTDELFEAIANRPFPDPRQKKSAAPAPLCAICSKAMAKDPADRYATAQALAADVQSWLADEPVSVFAEPILARLPRIARRNPGRMSALAATVLVSLVGLSLGLYFVSAEKNAKEAALERESTQRKEADRQKSIAVESSRLAQQRFDEKRSALDDMLAAFSDDRLKSQPGAQAVRKNFLSKGIEQYERMLKDRKDDVSVMMQAANAYRELGVVSAEIGDDDNSVRNLKKSLEICRQAVGTRDSPATREALGDALYELGQLYIGKADNADERAKLAAEARQIFEQLSEQEPDEPEYWAKVGQTLLLEANSRDPSSSPPPEDQLAIALLRKAVAAEPNEVVFLSELGRAIFSASFGDQNQTAKERIAALQEAFELQDQAIALRPNYSKALMRRGFTANVLTTNLIQIGRADEALGVIEDAIRSTKKAAEDNPAAPAIQDAVARLLGEKATILANLNRRADSNAARQEAITVYERLTTTHPGVPSYAWGVVESHRLIGAGAAPAKQLVQFQKIANLAERVTRRHPTHQDLLGEFIFAYNRVGFHLRSAGQLADSAEAYEAAVALFQRFSEEGGAATEHLQGTYLLAVTGLQQTYAQANQHDKVVKSTDRILKPIDLAALKEPIDQDRLLECRARMAKSLEKLGRNGEALNIMEAIVNSAKPLIALSDKSWYVHYRMLAAENEMARLANVVGDEQREFAALRSCLKDIDPYLSGRTHEPLLERTREFSPANLDLLRTAYPPRNADLGTKTLNVPVRYPSGVQVSLTFRLSDSWEFLEDQFASFEVGGGKVTAQARTALRTLYDFSQQHQLSFPDVCLFSLSEAAAARTAKSTDQHVSPVAVVGAPLTSAPSDTISKSQQLADARAKVLTGANDGSAVESVIYLAKLAEGALATGNAFRTKYFLDDAEYALSFLTKRNQGLELEAAGTYIAYLKAGQAALNGKHENARTAFMEILNSDKSDDGQLLVLPGACEFALGWIAERQDKPVEAAAWNLAAFNKKYPLAAAAIYGLGSRHPHTTNVLTPSVREALSKASEASKDQPGRGAELFAIWAKQQSNLAQPQAEGGERPTAIESIAAHYRTIGESYREQGKMDAALKSFVDEAGIRLELVVQSPASQRKLEYGQACHDVAALYAAAGDGKSRIEWLAKSAQAGHMEASLELADAFDAGQDVAKNPYKALDLRFRAYNGEALRKGSEGKYEESIVAFKKAHDLPEVPVPRRAWCAEKIGMCYGLQGKWDKAIQWYAKSVNAAPGVGASLNLLEAYIVSDQPERVLETLEQPALSKVRAGAAELQYVEALLLGFEAIALESLGRDAAKTLEKMRTVLKQRPSGPWSWTTIDEWLEEAELDDERKSRIRSVVKELKAGLDSDFEEQEGVQP